MIKILITLIVLFWYQNINVLINQYMLIVH